MNLQIENLKAQIRGLGLTAHQKGNALVEFESLINYIEELEAKNDELIKQLESLVSQKNALMVSVNKTSKLDGKKFNQFSHYIGYDRDKLRKYLLEKYKIQNLIKDIADEFPYFTDGGFRYIAENDNWQYEFVCHPYNVIDGAVFKP